MDGSKTRFGLTGPGRTSPATREERHSFRNWRISSGKPGTAVTPWRSSENSNNNRLPVREFLAGSSVSFSRPTDWPKHGDLLTQEPPLVLFRLQRLSLAFEIAVRSEDTDAAIGHLRALIGQGAATPEARLEWFGCCSSRGRHEEAGAQKCRSVLAGDGPDASTERTQAAYFLARLEGSGPSRSTLRFLSYRESTPRPPST